MQNMLDRIIAHKHTEVKNAKANLPLADVEAEARQAAPPRGFIDAITNAHLRGSPALIAEIKKASPSKGLIREDFDPGSLARAYEAGGATCISVLTDVAFFQGHPVYLKEVSQAASLPVLRKDFMIDPYQVVEARAWGADCILIIMAALDDETADLLTNLARDWGMDVLIEVHNRQELERALKLDSALIGINNRNLQTFDIKLEVTEGLAPLIPHDRIVVSESGIFHHEDLIRLNRVGVKTYLVGECLMRQDDVAAATQTLLGRQAGGTDGGHVAGQAGAQKAAAVAEESEDPDPHDAGSGGEVSGADFQAAVQELGAMIGATVGVPEGKAAMPKPAAASEHEAAAVKARPAEPMARSPKAHSPETQSPQVQSPKAGAQSPAVMAKAPEAAQESPQHSQGTHMHPPAEDGGRERSVASQRAPSEEPDAGERVGDEPAARLSHVNEAGAAHMVDISDKSVTSREAVAEGYVVMQPETLAQIQQNAMKKGDVLAAARLAGIMAAKKTSDLIPLCHPLQITGVDVEFSPFSQPATGIHVTARVKVNGKTGVEMEALTAVTVACLTIYDMAKAIDKGMTFSGIRLLEKSGGKSGLYRAAGAAE